MSNEWPRELEKGGSMREDSEKDMNLERALFNPVLMLFHDSIIIVVFLLYPPSHFSPIPIGSNF